MDSESKPVVRSFYSQWIFATVQGWFLGFAVVIVLALLLDLIGANVQSIVGIGMGAGVGYMQARLLRQRIGVYKQWMWSSVISMSLPFLAWDLTAALGIELPFSLLACVLIGSLILGLLQWQILRKHSDNAYWWVPGCILAWGLATAAPDMLVIVSILLGGVVLGAVTGAVLTRILPEQVEATI